MKITKLEISNFKNLNGTYEFDDVLQAYIGLNGAGKTSLIEAFIYALTNNCNSSNVIKNGESKMKVTMCLDDGSTFTREKSINGGNTYRVNGKTCPLKDFNEYLENITGLTINAIQTVSSSDLLNNISSEDLSSFIMSYIPDEIDLDKLYEYIGTIPDEIKDKVIVEISNSFPCDTKFGTRLITDIGADFEGERKLAKRKLRDLEGSINEANLIKPDRTLEAIEEDISNINLKKAEAKKVNEMKALYENIIKNKEANEKNILSIEKQLSENKATKPDGSIADVKKQIELTKNNMNNIQNTGKVLIKTNESLKKAIENLSKPVCPLSEKLTCKTDKSPILEELNEQIREIIIQYNEQHKQYSLNKENLIKLQDKEKAYLENEKLYINKESLEKQLKILKETKFDIPDKKPEVVDTTKLIENEKKLNEEKRLFIIYSEYLKAERHIKETKERIAITNFLADIFSAKGIVLKSILEYYITAFEELCNEKIVSINANFAVKFLYEKNVLKICAKTNNTDDKFIPYFNLSSGEKAIVLFGIMDMLNALSGLKILFIDDIDKFDKETFKAFIQILSQQSVMSEYDHIIMAGSLHDDISDNLSNVKVINM